MRLTKLELSGFKSFARKTELDFAQGITAVIGPNGSGKSNIADAVRWVLGEQSARSLRGSRMEDVIFAGTAERKPQGLAEVTLTFDNSDGKLNIPYNEVAITRRLYRSGESEYCINRATCRLKDVQELFRDTGIGKDGYSIIGQGKVDEILSNKSNDRRAALEEAAGVMRFRVRKEEAVRKLDHTAQNLERIEDILRELGERVGPLEEQSRAARRYLVLRDELKDLEINDFLFRYERCGEKISGAKAAIDQFGERSAEADGEAAALRERIRADEEKAEEVESRLQQQQKRLMTLMASVETYIGESKVLTERREHGEKDLKRLREQVDTLNARADELTQTLAGLDADTGRAKLIQRAENELSAGEAALAELEQAVSSAENELETKKNSIMDAMNRLADVRADASRFETMEKALKDRMESIRSEIGALDCGRAGLDEEYAAAQSEHGEKERAVRDAETALENARRNRSELQDKLAENANRCRMLETETGSVRSRLHLLEEMAKNREGYFNAVKHIMNAADRDPKLGAAIVGVVAELIRVPEEVENAVNMALGAHAQDIITPTAEDARFVIDTLRKRDYGRATLLPMALLRHRPPDEGEKRVAREEGCLGFASDLIGCDPGIRPVIDYLLGRTLVVKDLESGIRIKKKGAGGLTIATLDGDIISTGGAMSGGSIKKQQFSLLGREREIRELSETLAKKEERLAKSETEAESIRKDLLLAEIQAEAFREELEERRIEHTKSNEKLELIRHDVENENGRRSRLEEELAGLEENLADFGRQREESSRVAGGIESGNTASREAVRLCAEKLSELRARKDVAAERLTEQRIRLIGLKNEQEAEENERKRLLTERDECLVEAERNKAVAERVRLSLEEVAKALSETEKKVGNEKDGADEQRALERELEAQRQKISERVRGEREKLEGLSAELRDLADQKHKQELVLSRTELELQSLQDRIWADYELTYENALEFRKDLPVGPTAERISVIRKEIRGLGPINLAAIEDYKAVGERFETLSAQRDDLRKAEADLTKLVAELTGSMEKTFRTQFEVIRKNFNETFSELFGGGAAELRLADNNSVLDCDIDIIAQPPGKKLQLLSLLSGGERALTAIALLFALLKLKPPAFCVLDEIEAALDEENVSRFADYVKTYSHGTQFILITHRKGSMEVCDSLYGVSMEERGVSKVVSARFGEEKQ
ncbi:MAG: chromosome segregation protein SMC [Clostridia bacterium]|nr:chromosome segregation protein SMC [Clostridia bacterium]